MADAEVTLRTEMAEGSAGRLSEQQPSSQWLGSQPSITEEARKAARVMGSG